MTSDDWKDFVIHGLGGLLLFLLMGYAAVYDIPLYLDGIRPLFGYNNGAGPNFPRRGLHQLGIEINIILAILAMVGLITFLLNCYEVYKKLQKSTTTNDAPDD
jgi:ammonia channel protein AmtB